MTICKMDLKKFTRMCNSHVKSWKMQLDALLSSQARVYMGCGLTMQWLQGCQSYWDWVHQNLLAQTLRWMNTATLLLAAAMNQLRADQTSQPGWLGCFTEGTSTCTSTTHTVAKLFHYPGLPWPQRWLVEKGHSSNCSKDWATHLLDRKLKVVLPKDEKLKPWMQHNLKPCLLNHST